MTQSNPIAILRHKAEAWSTLGLWIVVPLIAVTAILNGNGWLAPLIAGIVTAGAVSAIYLTRTQLGEIPRFAIAVGAIAQTSLLVFAASGPWQIDFHMLYFAVLATLVMFCDWRVILAGAAATAVHHLVLNFALPAAVFPGGADFSRVLFHATVVILEVGVLMVVTYQLTHLFTISMNTQSKAEDTAQMAQEIAASHEAEAERSKRQQAGMERLIGQFNKSVVSVLSELVNDAQGMTATAQTMSDTANQNRTQATDVAATSSQATANVQTVAGAAEELTASVDEIRGQVSTAAQIAEEAANKSEASNAKVGELHEAAQAIGDVVKLIHDIADQTNLLALNATIEAARAGEAGKGFAVVASEVKSLANQTAKATQDISEQIGTIRGVIGDAVGTMEGVTGIVGEINQISSVVNDMVSQQSAATAEIARNVQEAAQGTVSVSNSMEDLTKSAEQSGMAAGSVETAAAQIVERSEALRIDVAAYMDAIQRAGTHGLFDPQTVDFTARLSWDDTGIAIRVTEFSALGVRIAGALDDAPMEDLAIAIDGVELPLPCEMTESDDDTAYFSFVLQTQHLEALAAYAESQNRPVESAAA